MQEESMIFCMICRSLNTEKIDGFNSLCIFRLKGNPKKVDKKNLNCNIKGKRDQKWKKKSDRRKERERKREITYWNLGNKREVKFEFHEFLIRTNVKLFS